MHGGALTEDEPMADINMIPLIDISLTLLIILMVTTTFARKPGVNLKLPETVTREGAQETPKDLTVAVSSTGDLYLNGEVNTPEQLQAKLKEFAAKDKEARVMIRGDRAVIYSRMMEVMDMIRQAGLTRVILPTDPKTLLQAPPVRGVPFGKEGDRGTRGQGEKNPNLAPNSSPERTGASLPNAALPNNPTTQQPNNSIQNPKSKIQNSAGEARTP